MAEREIAVHVPIGMAGVAFAEGHPALLADRLGSALPTSRAIEWPDCRHSEG